MGTHSFLGHKLAVSPFAWQSNKAILFYFTQDSVSEVQFGTSAQRPSFQHQYPEVTKLENLRAQPPRLSSLLKSTASSGVPQTTLRFNNSPKDSELTESYYAQSYCLLQGKGTDQNQLKEETYRADSGKVPNTKLCCPQDAFLCRHRYVTIHTEYCWPRQLTWASVSRLFMGLQRHDWGNDYPHGWTQSPELR